MAVVTLVALMLFAAMLVGFLRRRRSLFDVLAAHLHRLGIEVGPAMTMEEALRRLRAGHADAARELEPLIAMYEAERFSAQRDAKRAAALRRKLAALRSTS